MTVISRARVDRNPRVLRTEPDWTRERARRWWDPGPRLLAAVRGYQKWKSRGGPIGRLMAMLHVVRHRFWSLASGADIPLNCQIGGGLMIPHPNGIVIHPDAVIGPNCLILQQATLGTTRRDNVTPVVGGNVDIGAGAKVLGGVVIGDHAQIGANAVVLCDVPPDATAVGVPARILNAARARIEFD